MQQHSTLNGLTSGIGWGVLGNNALMHLRMRTPLCLAKLPEVPLFWRGKKAAGEQAIQETKLHAISLDCRIVLEAAAELWSEDRDNNNG